MLEGLARLGYASKAVLYGTVGVLAVLAATNSRDGAITDTSGALRVLLMQPYGRLVLIVLSIGLFGYAAWRLLDALLGTERDGRGVVAVVGRLGKALRGCIYGALGVDAVRLLLGQRSSNGDEAELWTARVLDLPFGAVGVGLAGVVVVAYGLWEIVKSIRARHGNKLDWSPIPMPARAPIQWIARLGVAVRGGLVATLGVFLVRAAVMHSPDEAAGGRESLIQLGGLLEGQWFLALIAIGLMAYGVDQAVHARCRRIRPVL
jgi:hypothetical protein